MKEQPRILTFGNVVMNGLYQIPQLHKQDRNVYASQVSWAPGGAAVHFAIANARLGAEVNVIGWVGSDSMGNQLIQSLRQHGVESSLHHIIAAQTPTEVIIFDETGGRVVILSPPIGTPSLPQPQEVALYDVQAFDHLHTHLFLKPYVDALLMECKRMNITSSLDIEPLSVKQWGKQAVEQSIAIATIVFIQEEALLLLSEHDLLEDRMKAIVDLGPHIVVCTGGKDGTVVVVNDQMLLCPFISAQSGSCLAASDIFAAAFTLLYVRGEDAESAVTYATAALAVALNASDLAVHYPTSAEINEMLHKHQPVIEKIS